MSLLRARVDLERLEFRQSSYVYYSKALQQATKRFVLIVGGERTKLMGGRLERQSTSALQRRISFGSSEASQSLPLQRDSMQTSLSGEIASWHSAQTDQWCL